MSILYTSTITATGGRRGSIRSEDGQLQLTLAIPEELGGPGGATNPEQLFAAGLAACFANELIRIACRSGHRFGDGDVTVIAEIGFNPRDAHGLVLNGALVITIAGVDQQTAEELVQLADASCAYTNAIRGNLEFPKRVVAI